MTAGSQKCSKYFILTKSNRPGTNRSRSTAERPKTILSFGIADHYKAKGRFFCDSKEGLRHDLIEAYPAQARPTQDPRSGRPASNTPYAEFITSRTSRFVTRDKCFLRRSEFLALFFSDFGILQVQ
jgi:hypothetical protein